jgi:hypothetical protein
MKGFIASALMAVGLLAGCESAEAPVDAQPGLEAREDALPSCGSREYVITYYAEPEHLTWVGEIVCTCDVPGSVLYGNQSQYPERVEGNFCPPPPPQ